VAEVITGMALSRFTVIEPETVGVCLLVARIVTLSGHTTAEGGVYTPLVEIDPNPVAGLKLHVANWFDVPAIVAPKATGAPRFTVVGPLIVTPVASGVVEAAVGSLEPELLLHASA
jgi:hypothetical protein